MKKKNIIEPELSRPLHVDKIPAGGLAEHVVARPLERQALAERFGLLDISLLEADLNVDHAKGRMLAVTGKLTADVVQQCVVTLDPVPARVVDAIDILYAPAGMLDVGANPPHSDELDNDAPEPIVNGVIDLGELVAQHLAVALNPYPRKEGAVLQNGASGEEEGNGVLTPFARLKELEKKTPKA